jgi:hypothetical protein
MKASRFSDVQKAFIQAADRMPVADSLCRATWICRPTSTASRLTSPCRESQPTTRSSKPSTAASGRNVSTQPARHREQAGKIYPSAVQRSVSLQ